MMHTLYSSLQSLPNRTLVLPFYNVCTDTEIILLVRPIIALQLKILNVALCILGSSFTTLYVIHLTMAHDHIWDTVCISRFVHRNQVIRWI